MEKILARMRFRTTAMNLLVCAAVALAMSVATVPAAGQTISMAAVGPSNLDFGQHTVGTQSSALPVILANAGSDPLAIARIVHSGDFAAVHDCPESLPAGGECHILISFKPTTVGVSSGDLTIENEAGTQRVFLRGAGSAPSKPSAGKVAN